ncbi:hypothetical protein Aduo_016086 [Ancylostoma duodenale]
MVGSNGVHECDVIVVGAGLAGLSAARELLRREPNLKVLVLEAKGRIGGRTLTAPIKVARAAQTHIDLGATWVSHSQKNILDLLNEFHIGTFPQYSDGKAWCQFGLSRPRCYRSLNIIRQVPLREAFDVWWSVRKMQRLAEKVDVNDLFRWEYATELNEISVGQWIRQNTWSRSGQDVLEIATRALYGVEPNRINMLYHLAACKSAGSISELMSDAEGGARALRIDGGTQQIAKRLAEEIGTDRIRLHRAVNRIEVDEANGITRVHFFSTDGSDDKGAYVCSQVVTAIPPNQCARIDFSPTLPHLKRLAFEASIPGNLIMFVITYETAFWREEGWSGEIISSGRTTKRGEVRFYRLFAPTTTVTLPGLRL